MPLIIFILCVLVLLSGTAWLISDGAANAQIQAIANAGKPQGPSVLVIVAVLIFLLVVVALVIEIIRLRRHQQPQTQDPSQSQERKWAPGPNARFQHQGSIGSITAPGNSHSNVEDVLMLMMIQKMISGKQQQYPPDSNDPWRWQ